LPWTPWEGTTVRKTLFYNGKNKPPVAPSGLVPFELTELTLGQKIRWQASYDADQDPLTYTVQMDTAPLFTHPVSYKTNKTHYQINESLSDHFPDDTRVYWRVRASDNWGGISKWSTFGTFYINFDNTPPYWGNEAFLFQPDLWVTHKEQVLRWPKALDDDFSDRDSIRYLIRFQEVRDTLFFSYHTFQSYLNIPVEDLSENKTYRYTITARDRQEQQSKEHADQMA